MVEMMAAIAVILCISAIAVPNFMIAIANLRLRSGMSSLSGIIQNCRMQAIKYNKVYSVHFTSMSHGPVAYIKEASDTSALNSQDLQVQLGAPLHMDQNPSGPGAPTLFDASYFNTSTSPNLTDPSFSPRGMPCTYSGGTCTTLQPFVFYFTDTRPLGASGWGAVTITPAGRVKTWFWNGSAWID